MIEVAIAGGGLIGSLVAWRAMRAGAKVQVFDAGCQYRCSNAAAGMLSPTAELATTPAAVGKLGQTSLSLWQDWLAELDLAQALTRRGSLLAAHGTDIAELERVAKLIANKGNDTAIVRLDAATLTELEPELTHLAHAYYLPHEGHLDTDTVLNGLRTAVTLADHATWHDDTHVDEVAPNRLRIAGSELHCDWACDCRGLGATATLNLRPVRGEIIHLEAPAVHISRPVRLAHPRYPVYVVPRTPNHYLIGATEIESSDTGALTVRSALELLGAAYSLHSGFGEANVTEARVGLRPALPDHQPRLQAAPGLISINGMYRHGFLTGPALVAQAIAHMGLT